MQNKLVLTIIVLVLVGGSFYAGMSYGQKNRPSNGFNRQFSGRQGADGQTGGQRGPGGRNGGGFVVGQILSIDDKSMTVSVQSGGSKNVLLSDSSKIQKTVDGTVADLVKGKDVVVTGTPNADGSITAQSIQLRTMPAGAGR